MAKLRQVCQERFVMQPIRKLQSDVAPLKNSAWYSPWPRHIAGALCSERRPAAPDHPHHVLGCSIVQNRLKTKDVAVVDAAALSLRTVHRAASDLRRGTPVLLK